MPQVVLSDLLLYADDTSIVFQDKNVTEIEKQLLRDFWSLCDWFVDHKLSIGFGQDKTKSKQFYLVLNVLLKVLQFIVSDIFKFHNDQYHDYFDELFCPVGENSVITRSSNKKLKLPFWQTKLGIQSLSYVGPNTWNSHPGDLKAATSVNPSKHCIKEYFLKKLGNVAEADIYSYN